MIILKTVRIERFGDKNKVLKLQKILLVFNKKTYSIVIIGGSSFGVGINSIVWFNILFLLFGR